MHIYTYIRTWACIIMYLNVHKSVCAILVYVHMCVCMSIKPKFAKVWFKIVYFRYFFYFKCFMLLCQYTVSLLNALPSLCKIFQLLLKLL